jgi:hypothetical protein
MQHAHVSVYNSDHADPRALAHDYVGLDLDEVPAFVEELMRRYSDAVGAQSGLGTLDDVVGAGAVTLWPQDGTLEPVHIALHACGDPHDLCSEGVGPRSPTR